MKQLKDGPLRILDEKETEMAGVDMVIRLVRNLLLLRLALYMEGDHADLA